VSRSTSRTANAQGDGDEPSQGHHARGLADRGKELLAKEKELTRQRDARNDFGVTIDESVAPDFAT
jgi:hypothetical protein